MNGRPTPELSLVGERIDRQRPSWSVISLRSCRFLRTADSDCGNRRFPLFAAGHELYASGADAYGGEG